MKASVLLLGAPSLTPQAVLLSRFITKYKLGKKAAQPSTDHFALECVKLMMGNSCCLLKRLSFILTVHIGLLIGVNNQWGFRSSWMLP